jgi:hypothetical protein
MLYRPCINKNDTNEWKSVVALIPDDGVVGDYLDGYENYQYTQLDFTIEAIPAITEGLVFEPQDLLFVTKDGVVRCKTQEEL